MDDKLRIVLVMSAVLGLLLIGVYKKEKQDSESAARVTVAAPVVMMDVAKEPTSSWAASTM